MDEKLIIEELTHEQIRQEALEKLKNMYRQVLQRIQIIDTRSTSLIIMGMLRNNAENNKIIEQIDKFDNSIDFLKVKDALNSGDSYEDVLPKIYDIFLECSDKIKEEDKILKMIMSLMKSIQKFNE